MLRSNLRLASFSRRWMLRSCASAGALLCLPAPFARARADDLAQRLREAARKGGAVSLPPGEMSIAGLDLPDGAILKGAPGGRTVLKLSGLGPLLSARMARRIKLENLVLDGAGGFAPKEQGLLDFSDVVELSINGCVIRGSARGINLARCGGVIAQNEISDVVEAGLFSLDGLGLDIDNNVVRRCGDNGVLIQATAAGRYDGSRIRNNLIEDIENRSGGDGPYGNGVLIWGAGVIRVEKNHILRCAYTAVRNNAGHAVEVTGNDCKGCGEKAMYAEFGARNSIFRDNRIEDAGAGIAVANADKGTDGAIVSGNVIINMRKGVNDPEFGPEMLWLTGILGEKNVDIVGNRIVGPGWIGVALGGWRDNLRAEDNEISGVDYGVVLATGDGVGDALVARNRISARKAAVIASAGMNFLPGDLTKPDAKKYPRLTVRENDAG